MYERETEKERGGLWVIGFSKESKESLFSARAKRFDGAILNPETISHECHTVALHNCAPVSLCVSMYPCIYV